jgi:hypothetical protein
VILAAGVTGSAGPLGLLIVLLIAVATILLIRNMNARLKRLPPTFEPPDEVSRPDDPSDGNASGPSAGA